MGKVCTVLFPNLELEYFVLLTNKFLDFYSWLEIAEKFFSGKVNHKILLPKAKEIKHQMNDQRKVFT